ncbi:hypothetical protein K435DRAFT_881347 [Dendrothele bispora CBS 962.96]|uniref:Uncharacterized protein n=1 Tax=Dendrothele bispora (strain CBS 962.96) TaxID=1314807 RepID=A0A4S8KJE8_DENBC|nr:hypothetical protein K435DRAFT_881347 [Dendrothele bispora CBS 962.96]
MKWRSRVTPFTQNLVTHQLWTKQPIGKNSQRDRFDLVQVIQITQPLLKLLVTISNPVLIAFVSLIQANGLGAYCTFALAQTAIHFNSGSRSNLQGKTAWVTQCSISLSRVPS